VSTYLHRLRPGPAADPRVLVQLDAANEAVAKDLAQQIAATPAQYVHP